MRRTLLRRVVASSVVALTLLGTAGPVRPARRPRYGGTLRVEIGAVLTSLDPLTGAMTAEENRAKDDINSLLYERGTPEGPYVGVAGSGPFRIAEWEAGRKVALAANDDFRQGRPFLDAIEIQMGRGARDRLLDVELDRADIAEIPVEQVRRASERGVRVSLSLVDELVAIAFISGRPMAEDALAREALSRSIDRTAIVNFILQKQGEAAGGLLPQWSSGTAFLFSTALGTASAGKMWSEIGGSRRIALGYDAGDLLEQSIAERIAVDAREAGGSVSAMATKSVGDQSNLDARLVRLRMVSPNPHDALAGLLSALDPIVGGNADSLPGVTPQQIYEAEHAILSTYRVVPLVWLPQAYGLSARVRNWKTPAPGQGWPLADVWLGDAP